MNATEWLNDEGFELCRECLQELRAKGVERIYVSNFEFIPDEIDKKELCKQLNKDAGEWKFELEDADVLATVKRSKRA